MLHTCAPGKRGLTSLPTVMAAITFFTASFFLDLSRALSSCLSSWISPAHSGGSGGRAGASGQHSMEVLLCISVPLLRQLLA